MHIAICHSNPPKGMGDTEFANMYWAYDNLNPPSFQSKLQKYQVLQSSSLHADVLRGNHLKSSTSMAATTTTTTTRRRSTAAVALSYQALHPAVRTHSETGRQALFVNPAHSAALIPNDDDDDDEEEEEESKSDEFWTRKLELPDLFAQATCPENILRISWEPGTLVVWDNRCLIHRAMNDYDGHRRVMWRITIAGDKPI